MDTKADRLKAALQKRIDELRDAQFRRASVIETALVQYEKSIRIRSVSDYIALSNQQRRLMGINDNGGKSVSVTQGDQVITVKWQD